MYADFEALIKPISTCSPSPNLSHTTSIAIHEACSFAYYIKCSYNDDFSIFRTYRGVDSSVKFVEMLITDINSNIYELLKNKLPISLSEEEEKSFQEATICFYCEENIIIEKVRDHCHLTGIYRGASHNSCNINAQNPNFIPVIFHNLSGYDSHLFIKNISDFVKKEIKIIPNNKESYISFAVTLDRPPNYSFDLTLRFIDSFKFMSTSLSKLVATLHVDQFKNLKKYFSSKHGLLIRKGVYPYEYVDKWERFTETILPPKSSFFSKVNDSDISDDDYEYAQTVWTEFEVNNLGEYSDLYLKTDVLLLADVFETFRDVCLTNYKLDPCWYYTAPGLSWDAMLKCTKVRLQLLSDIEMILFIKKGIRGGLSQCSKRYAKANNKYCQDFDENIASKYLLYLDANNLYGLAMSFSLPSHGFKWLTEQDLDTLNNDLDFIKELKTDESYGFIFEVDLQYPRELHDLHNDLPFCAENILTVNCTQLKLIPTLNNRVKYVIHYETLKQCIKHGLIITKVHRGIIFQQSKWLKCYIDKNTLERSKATNDFEKDFYKLMNNSVFGKTMENIEKHLDVKLKNRWENRFRSPGAADLIARPNFHSFSIFTDQCVAIQMNRTKLLYNKPIYVGFSVLDISKLIMYSFHYDVMKPVYRENLSLLYTDTDSLVYEIQVEDVYEEIKKNINFFDTSDYPTNNQYNIPLVNNKIMGKMKDENNGKIFLEFVGLRSKMYSIKVENKVSNKSKGVNKCVVRKLKFDDYKNILFNRTELRGEMLRFKTLNHNIYTHLINKTILNVKDTKRYILEDGINTLAWGNYKIPQNLI